MNFSHLRIGLIAACVCIASQAQGQAKDIVLDRVAAPLVSAPSAGPRQDAMVVSVLLESADGSLAPKSTETPFQTGDRFRVKLLASRPGHVALYNTNPSGIFNPVPIWRGEVRTGQETISPRLALDGASGVDQLHVVLEPAGGPVSTPWLGRWFDRSVIKDIRLDQQSSTQATYLLADPGAGLLTTVRIVHR